MAFLFTPLTQQVISALSGTATYHLPRLAVGRGDGCLGEGDVLLKEPGLAHAFGSPEKASKSP